MLQQELPALIPLSVQELLDAGGHWQCRARPVDGRVWGRQSRGVIADVQATDGRPKREREEHRDSSLKPACSYRYRGHSGAVNAHNIPQLGAEGLRPLPPMLMVY